MQCVACVCDFKVRNLIVRCDLKQNHFTMGSCSTPGSTICRQATLKRFTVTVKRQHATMLPELPWCSSNSVKDNRRRSRNFLVMNINFQYTERRALNRWRSIHHLKTTVGTLSVTRHPTDRISELTRNNVDELNPLKWRACLVHLPRGCRSATIRSPPEGLAKVW